jgi:Nrap protein domain 6
VDPHGHIDDEDRNNIMKRFEQVRGPSHERGPPMYIVSPNDRRGREDPLNETPEETSTAIRKPEKKLSLWDPSFTTVSPEMVVLIRMKALAKRSRDFLLSKLTLFDSTSWSSAFQETETSFRGYSALLRVDSDFVVDENSSSTGVDLAPLNSGSNLESSYTTSMRALFLGPKPLRLKNYRNMIDDERHQILYDWRPIDHLMSSLRVNFGSHALFFYNQLCPSVIALLWRPQVSAPQSFAVVNSEFAQPCVSREWKNDTMVIVNANDLFREMSQYYESMVTNVKVFQAPTPKETSPSTPSQAKKRKPDGNSESDSSEND